MEVEDFSHVQKKRYRVKVKRGRKIFNFVSSFRSYVRVNPKKNARLYRKERLMMVKWSDIREKHLSDPEVAEEYLKLPPVELVAQIKRARKRKGLTQSELAKMIGTKQPAIARIESGRYLGYSISILLKIAEALDTSLTIKPSKRLRLKASTSRGPKGISQKKVAEA